MTERKIKRIEYSKRFLKSLQKLPKRTIEKAQEKEVIFKRDPFHPLLNTHKLSGKDKECWSFWIDYLYRVKFSFLSDEEVLFLDVGPHNVYR